LYELLQRIVRKLWPNVIHEIGSRKFLKELSNELREKPKPTTALKPPATVKLPQLPNHMPKGSKAAAQKAEQAAAGLESRLDPNV
jgi:ribosomal protein S4